MKTMWKFQLIAEEIPMPLDAEVAHFDFQDGVPCIWAIVDPTAVKNVRRFRIFGTGSELPLLEEGCYVGTAQQPPFVWHLFELL